MSEAGFSDRDPQPTTTARELANSLETYAEKLSAAAQKIEHEREKVQENKAEIQEEYDAVVRSFVEAEVTEIDGPRFDKINGLSENVQELNTQSLSFLRDKALKARDRALDDLNKNQDGPTIDAAGFQERKEEAIKAVDDAREKSTQARLESKAASKASDAWKKTEAFAFVKLDEAVTTNGGRPLKDNRDYYNPRGWLLKAKNWLFEGADYRKVRRELASYGQGTKGRDVFAEIASWKTQTAQLEKADVSAEETLSQAVDAVCEKKASFEKFHKYDDVILSDDKIVKILQDKVVTFFDTEAFLTEAAKEYGEDFPRKIPVLFAKGSTLFKLECGLEDKGLVLAKQIDGVEEQYEKIKSMSRRRPDREVPVDLETLQKRQNAQLKEYDYYTDASYQSRSRAMSFEPSTTVVYHDNSPSFFETMLMVELLSPSHAHETTIYHDAAPTYSPAETTPFAANLLGLDQDAASNMGLPDSVFEPSPEVQSQMADWGLDSYTAGMFSNTDLDAGQASEVFPVDRSVDDFLSGGAGSDHQDSGSNFWDNGPSLSDDEDRFASLHDNSDSSPGGMS